MNKVRAGSHYFLRPAGLDASDFRVTYWKDYIVRVIRRIGCPRWRKKRTCHVETRLGDYIGPVLIASLQPLDRRTKNALRREARRSVQTGI